jgi:thiol-disulfide isomerase/thioredoxin
MTAAQPFGRTTSLRRALGVAGALAMFVPGACGPASSPAAAPAANAAPAAAAAPVAAAPPAKTVQLNAPGAAVDVAAALPAGYVTVVDFWSQSCEACGPLGARLEAGVADEPRVLIRKVDVGDGDTPVAAAYKIAALPHFFIYDKLRRLRYDLVGGDCTDAARFARQLATE